MEGTDVQCERLLKALTKLRKIVEAPEHLASFDIENDVSCEKKYHELRRLARSLEQYNTKTGHLTYVGLLGHFSSGKSSIINRLLNLYKTEDERPTDQHPTDKTVTLITHQQNSESLIGMDSRGELKVVTSFIKNKLLKTIVMVDTPGSGDPLILDDLIRDFLPVCDQLVYVFSAASPLDKTDLPILLKAHTELPFIPMAYIVTRADEFKREPKTRLSSKNFDHKRAERFIETFIERLSVVAGIQVDANDILLVDNLSCFQTDRLYALIASSEQDSKALAHLHSHKIQYFVNSARLIGDHFVDHLQEKYNALEELLCTAKENHAHYQKTIRVHHDRLSGSWNRQKERLNTAKSHLIGSADQWALREKLPAELRQLGGISERIDSCRNDMEELSSSQAGNLCHSLKSRFTRAFRSRLTDITREVGSSQDATKIIFSGMTVDVTPFDLANKMPPLPLSVKDRLRTLSSVAAVEIRKEAYKIIETCEHLSHSIETNQVLNVTSEIVEVSKDQISDMLDAFTESVSLYKAAILAMNARRLAEKAGITTVIDELEDIDIDSQKKQQWLKEMTSKIFPEYEQYNQQLAEGLSVKREKLSVLASELRQIVDSLVPEPADVDIVSPSEAELEAKAIVHKAISKATDSFHDRCAKVFSSMEHEKIELLKEPCEEFEASIQKLRQRRRRKLTGFAVLGVIVVLIIYLFFQPSFLKVEQSIPVTIIVGLAVHLIGGLCSWGIGLLFDSTDTNIWRSKDDHNRQVRTMVLEMLHGKHIGDWRFIDNIKNQFKKGILEYWHGDMDRVILPRVLDAFRGPYEDLRSKRTLVEEIMRNYKEQSVGYIERLSKHYESTKENLKAIEEVAEKIRDETIHRSFTCFEKRSEDLKSQLEMLKQLELA